MARFAVLASIALAAGSASAAPTPVNTGSDFEIKDFDWSNWKTWKTYTSWWTENPGASPNSISDTSVYHGSHKWYKTFTATASAAASASTSSSDSVETTAEAGSTASTTTTISTETPTTTITPETSAKPAPSPSTGSGSPDIDAYLKGHNDIRAQHGAAPLVWSDDLATAAGNWAGGCVFQHSQGKVGKFGENLAAGTRLTAAAAVKMWTDEASQYDPANPQYSHFTQVVWKATSEVGCAVVSCPNMFPGTGQPANYHVCEYRSPGNVIGQFAQNVQA